MQKQRFSQMMQSLIMGYMYNSSKHSSGKLNKTKTLAWVYIASSIAAYHLQDAAVVSLPDGCYETFG